MNFGKKVRLYDPHPGFARAAIPLPQKIKEFIDTLDNQVMTLAEAVEKIEAVLEKVGIGEIKIVEQYNFISLIIPYKYAWKDGKPTHMFRLIKFKEVG